MGEEGDVLSEYDEGLLDGIERGMNVAAVEIVKSLRQMGLEQAAVLIEREWVD